MQRDANGAYWWGRGYEIGREPRVVRDLGLADGQAGVVAALASVAASPFPSAACALELLGPATDWLIAQGRLKADGAETIFSHSVEEADRPGRDAWCYGDPGVGLALWQAGEARGDSRTIEAARCVLRAVVSRTAASTTAVDASLCHGWGFLASLPTVLSDRVGVDASKFGAYWLHVIEAQLAKGDPLTYVGPDHRVVTSLSMLQGDVGVVVALLSLATEKAPLWTDLLLVRPVQTYEQVRFSTVSAGGLV